MIFRPMPVLTALSLIALIILICLGNWQYTRYRNKIASAPALETPALQSLVINIDRSHPGAAQQVYGLIDGEPVWRIYAPGRLSGTGARVLVLVRVTGGTGQTPQRIADLPKQVAFQGNILQHSDKKQFFGPANEPAKDTWYRFDASGMAHRLGLENVVPDRVEPAQLRIQNSTNPARYRITVNPYAYGRPHDPLPPERHFGYALTWWGMALGLTGVYLALHRARGRLRFKKT